MEFTIGATYNIRMLITYCILLSSYCVLFFIFLATSIMEIDLEYNQSATRVLNNKLLERCAVCMFTVRVEAAARALPGRLEIELIHLLIVLGS